MKLAHEDYEHLTVLTLRGDLAADEAETFREAAQNRLESQIRDFVLDLSGVEFVDSKGLEALLWLQEQCGQKLGQVRLAGVTANVEKILQVTRLTSRLDRQNSVDEAIASLRV